MGFLQSSMRLPNQSRKGEKVSPRSADPSDWKGPAAKDQAMTMGFAISAALREPDGRMEDEATIGEVAREFAISLRTLRFYEDRGLLHPRRQGVSRYYSAADRLRLREILKGKQFGFTLTEIRDLIEARQSGRDETDIEETLDPQQIVDQICHLERQRDELEAAIRRLRTTYERRAADKTTP
jgi:DNA-binding transcriptional MerR regulator